MKKQDEFGIQTMKDWTKEEKEEIEKEQAIKDAEKEAEQREYVEEEKIGDVEKRAEQAEQDWKRRWWRNDQSA